MMKNKLIIGILALIVIACGLFFAFKALMKAGGEEVIVYENKVVETIDAQLKDLPMDSIRAKHALIMEKSIDDIQSSIKKGELTYTELTAFYLDRIKSLDKATKGINSVVEINPNAIALAKKMDAEKPSVSSPMYGIPVLLKDNINTKDMPTSGGTFALKGFTPSANAAMVNTLISNNAIILGKANLSELANFFDIGMPSGYSSKLGQTHNPFDPLRISPQGSSSGSGAAVAANFCSVAIGTETTGSIVAPANAQSLVGFKPTKGLVSTEGVLPLSSTMDVVGPMAKNVKDAIYLLNASIEDTSKHITITYSANDLTGKRIGVLKTTGSEKIVEALKKAGAIPVELPLDFNPDSVTIIYQDFKNDFAAYAEKCNAPIKSLPELVEYNKKDLDRRAKYGQGLLEEAAKMEKFDREKVNKIVQETQAYIKKIYEEHKLDAVVFANNEASSVPCIAGYPEITVPFGASENKEPFGATFFSLKNDDEKLANIAYAFEQSTNLRLIPEKYKEVIAK
ncbi:MAG: amidase [Tissierellia bacterium]|nr:amidase [Tissierellia bacterium]